MTDIKAIMDNARLGISSRVSGKIKAAEAKGSKSFEASLKSAVETPGPGDRGRAIDKKLMDTCVEMESLLVARMFKEMRKSIQKNDWLHGGFAEEVFEDMLYDEHALNLSKNTKLGIANMLYKELSKTG